MLYAGELKLIDTTKTENSELLSELTVVLSGPSRLLSAGDSRLWNACGTWVCGGCHVGGGCGGVGVGCRVFIRCRAGVVLVLGGGPGCLACPAVCGVGWVACGCGG